MPQSPASSTKSKPDVGVVKHRACDECRTRKLACSKELDGCSRCRKEGWKCVYSPQKPMGRPRKRRHVEEADEQQASASASASPHQTVVDPTTSSSQLQFTTLPPSGGQFDMDYSAFYDAGDYTHMGGMDLPYCDFFSPIDGLPQSNMVQDYSDLSFGYTEPSAFSPSGLQFGGVDLLGGINFDEKDPANQQMSKDINKQTRTIMSIHAEFEKQKARAEERDRESRQSTASPPNLSSQNESSDTSPSDTTDTSEPPAASPSTGKTTDNSDSSKADKGKEREKQNKALPNAQCACLSQIYLALDSLTRLPEDIIEAMKTARAAAKAAHDAIVCPVCSAPFYDDVIQTPPMQAFQNTMLLGTLLPTTANAYIQILEMVDNITAEAKEKDEMILFRLLDYGGYWGRWGDLDKITCQTVEFYNNKEMKPDHWRLTIRALLKLDVYGFQLERTSIVDGSHISHRHLGLKDVIRSMEERSNRRHDQIDALVAAGEPHPMKDGPYGILQCQMTNKDKDDRQCLKIVEIARVALDKLVIA